PRAPARAYLSLLPSGPGEVRRMTPHEGSVRESIGPRRVSRTRTFHSSDRYFPGRDGKPVRSTVRLHVEWSAEDSPSGLGRTLGKRVGGNPSRVRIPYPPHRLTRQHEAPDRPAPRGLVVLPSQFQHADGETQAKLSPIGSS